MWLKRDARTAARSSSGIGASDRLTGEMFRLATGTEITHAPYGGGGPAMTSLLSGDAQMSCPIPAR